METVAQASAGAGAEAARPPDEIQPSAGSSWRPPLLMAAGCLLTGLIVAAAALAVPAALSATPRLEAVAKDQIDSAVLSMGPQVGASTIDEARQCRVPLGVVTVSGAAGTSASHVRIRSGSYLSPAILVTPSPQRVAIPFPAPYPTGKGVLIVEGAASGLNVWLTPGLHYTRLDGPAAINVIWFPRVPPC